MYLRVVARNYVLQANFCLYLLIFTGYILVVHNQHCLQLFAFFFLFTQLTLSLRFLVIYCASHCLLLLLPRLLLLLSSILLSIYLFARLFVRLSVCQSVRLPGRLSLSLSACLLCLLSKNKCQRRIRAHI